MNVLIYLLIVNRNITGYIDESVKINDACFSVWSLIYPE